MVESFDTWGEALARMEEREQAANARVTPEQRSIGWDDYWLRLWRDGDDVLAIFGHVWPEERAKREPDEAEEAEATYRRGYRFGEAFSVACPEGELGDTHIADMMLKLSAEEFAVARACGWDTERLREERIEAWAGVLIRAMALAGFRVTKSASP